MPLQYICKKLQQYLCHLLSHEKLNSRYFAISYGQKVVLVSYCGDSVPKSLEFIALVQIPKRVKRRQQKGHYCRLLGPVFIPQVVPISTDFPAKLNLDLPISACLPAHISGVKVPLDPRPRGADTRTYATSAVIPRLDYLTYCTHRLTHSACGLAPIPSGQIHPS